MKDFNEKGFMDNIKKIILQKEKMILLVLVGILFFVISMPVKEKEEKKNSISNNLSENTYQKNYDENEYKKELEKQLEEVLENMEGVGKVQVMITLCTSKEQILAKNEPYSMSTTQEEDGAGGIRNIEEKSVEEAIVYGQSASGEETPYVVKEVLPRIEGVFIVAEGGNQEEIQLQITEAVQALFDIEIHKIKIAKRKS